MTHPQEEAYRRIEALELIQHRAARIISKSRLFMTTDADKIRFAVAAAHEILAALTFLKPQQAEGVEAEPAQPDTQPHDWMKGTTYEILPAMTEANGEAALGATYTPGNGIKLVVGDVQEHQVCEFHPTDEQARMLGEALLRWANDAPNTAQPQPAEDAVERVEKALERRFGPSFRSFAVCDEVLAALHPAGTVQQPVVDGVHRVAVAIRAAFAKAQDDPADIYEVEQFYDLARAALSAMPAQRTVEDQIGLSRGNMETIIRARILAMLRSQPTYPDNRFPESEMRPIAEVTARWAVTEIIGPPTPTSKGAEP